MMPKLTMQLSEKKENIDLHNNTFLSQKMIYRYYKHSEDV